MFGIVFKLFGIAMVVVFALYLVADSLRKARRLDTRIQKFKEEQEALQKQGRALDPYAAMAELYTEEPSRPRRPSSRK